MRRMLTWLRPGGFVLIESFCWSPVRSSPYELDEFHALLRDDTFWGLAPALVRAWGRK